MAMSLASAQTSNPFAADQKAADAGFGFFHIYCSACHGKHAQGGRAPDLTRGTFSNGDRDADLFRVISNGVAGTDMAAYQERLSPDNIWRIIAFIRSTNGGESKLAGNSSNGEALFWGKGACGNCHAVGTRGNQIGPDLTRIGRQRPVSYLRTSLVTPDQDIAFGYESVTVVTRDGKTLRGIERTLDDFSVQFMDLQGHYYSFERSEVQSVQRDIHSLMPDYSKVFSAEELDDLLAYLVSLRGAEVKQ